MAEHKTVSRQRARNILNTAAKRTVLVTGGSRGIGKEACEFLMLAMTVAAFGALITQELVYRLGHCCGTDWMSARVYLLNIKKKALAEQAKKDEEQMLLDLEAQSSSSEEDEFDDFDDEETRGGWRRSRSRGAAAARKTG